MLQAKITFSPNKNQQPQAQKLKKLVVKQITSTPVTVRASAGTRDNCVQVSVPKATLLTQQQAAGLSSCAFNKVPVIEVNIGKHGIAQVSCQCRVAMFSL